MRAIVAMDSNGLIGKGTKLPWHYPEDLKFFKERTLNCPVIMGRKTFQSIGKPLVDRENIILTRSKTFQHEGTTVFNSKQDIMEYLSEKNRKETAWVAGGLEVYRYFWDDIKIFYVTHIPDIYDGDTFFPVDKLKEDFEWIQSIRLETLTVSAMVNRSLFTQT